MRIVWRLNCAPTGFCIQALAIRIHSADRLEPSATSAVTTRCADLREPLPAEEEQSDEGRLEKERHQALDRERRAEDVAHVVRVVGPVGAELELHGDAGRDPHGEVDAEQQPPEARHALPDLAPGHHVHRLHDHQDHGQAERQRHEQEVIQRGERELQARQRDDREVDHRACSGPPVRPAPAGLAGAAPAGADHAALRVPSRRPPTSPSTKVRCAGEKHAPTAAPGLRSSAPRAR